MFAAYACTMPAADPFSAFTTICTGRRAGPDERILEVVRDRQDHRHAPVEQRLVRPDPATPTARRSGSARTRRTGSTRPRDVARPIEIDDVGRRVPDRERRRVRQDEQLDDRHDEDLRERRAIADDVQNLGARERQDPAHRYVQPLRGTTACSTVSSTRRHPGQDQRLLPQVLEPDALQHDAAGDLDEPPGRDDVARRSAAARGMLSIGKMKPESSIVGSIVPIMRAHHRHALRRRPRGNEDAERQRHEDEQQTLGEQQHEAAAQRHVEDQPRLDDARAAR